MSDNPIADQNNDQPATESNKDMQWFVVQAFSNYEKRVKLTLEESIPVSYTHLTLPTTPYV